MTYIEELIKANIEPTPEQISLADYLKELTYITKYMSPRIKSTNIVVYHAMFYLSYGKTGLGLFSLPWSEIGVLCCNDRGLPIQSKETVSTRTRVLIELDCIKIIQGRTKANSFMVSRPSEIPFVRDEIENEKNDADLLIKKNKVDHYNDPKYRSRILHRDQFKCAYCLIKVTPETYVLDHILPRAKGGSNFKNNLITSCEICNSKKSDGDVWEFMLENYRGGLMTQHEFSAQQKYLKIILEGTDTGEL